VGHGKELNTMIRKNIQIDMKNVIVIHELDHEDNEQCIVGVADSVEKC